MEAPVLRWGGRAESFGLFSGNPGKSLGLAEPVFPRNKQKVELAESSQCRL